jgi:hypothetical protein
VPRWGFSLSTDTFSTRLPLWILKYLAALATTRNEAVILGRQRRLSPFTPHVHVLAGLQLMWDLGGLHHRPCGCPRWGDLIFSTHLSTSASGVSRNSPGSVRAVAYTISAKEMLAFSLGAALNPNRTQGS